MNKDGCNTFTANTDDLQWLLKYYDLFYNAESEQASEFLDKYLGILREVSYDTYCVWEIVKDAYLRGAGL